MRLSSVLFFRADVFVAVSSGWNIPSQETHDIQETHRTQEVQQTYMTHQASSARYISYKQVPGRK